MTTYPAQFLPGDIGIVRDYDGHGDLIGNLILAGETTRYGEAFATHSFVFVTEDGGIVEAEANGIEHNDVSKYVDKEVRVIHFDAPGNDPRRAFACRYALMQVGDSYGVVGFLALAVDLLFNLKLGVHVDRQPICSELAARATESMTRAGWRFPPERMMPDDLWADTHLLPVKEATFRKRVRLLVRAFWWTLKAKF